MSSSPYIADGPTLISFSGGRTSAFMLHETLRAYGGRLPDHVVVAFANTGKEREETLRFVHECGSRWGVHVRWVEWRKQPPRFEEVGFNSASRNGEPFAALIAHKQFLPNVMARFCTTKLKVETMKALMLSLGHERWLNAIGLRYDEGIRVLKQLARNEQGKERWTTVMPLSKARITKRDVMEFWEKQDFDLQLRPYEGNCDLCFLKARGKLEQIMRERPGSADWWIEQERLTAEVAKTPAGAQFISTSRGQSSYAEIAQNARDQLSIPGVFDLSDEHDTECGLHCEPMEPA